MSFAVAGIPTLPSLGTHLIGGGGVLRGGSHQTRAGVHLRALKTGGLNASFLKQPGLVFSKFQTRPATGRVNQMQSAAAICASAYDARCAIAEPLTISRSSSPAMVASPPSKQTMPLLLDDGGGTGGTGTKTKPYYRGGGGGGGGNGKLPTSREFPWGDYWLLIFLLLLRFVIENIIQEGTSVYKREDGEYKPIRRYA